MRHWSRPSPGGRRLALDRKWKLNVAHYGDSVSIGTLTAPGADLLPWDTSLCTHAPGEKCSGEKGCSVEWIYREVYNRTFSARRSRLHEAACKAADRFVRRIGYEGKLPRNVGAVSGPQRRGVLHAHVVCRGGAGIEAQWSRVYWRFIKSVCDRESKLPAAERWAALEREYATGEITRGVYGFGFQHRGALGRSAEKASRYMAKNAAGYMASNAYGAKTWHYVSAELTKATGVTMGALKSLNYVYVRRRLIAAGELLDTPFPGWWAEERCELVRRLESMVSASHAPPPADSEFPF
jgi:hypothetical protein